jgi:hypothetical protein
MSLPEGFRISLDPGELQLEVIHGYLTSSNWSLGIPMHAVEGAVRNSLVAGAYEPSGVQVGFARVVTDHASFGYLADVFVLEAFQGRDLGKAGPDPLWTPQHG